MRFSDPFGLINFLFGGGFSLIAPTGVEGSVGIVVNPGVGGSQADGGIFASGGVGGGLNVSTDLFVGVVRGGIENVSGVTGNINLIVGPISMTLLLNNDVGLLGGTIGIGPGIPIPIQASGTVSDTSTLTVRDVLNLLFSDVPSRTNTRISNAERISGAECR